MKYKIGLLAIFFSFSQWAIGTTNPKDLVVIDCRTTEEYRQTHVQGALNYDVLREEDFIKKTKTLDKSKSYKLYCGSGKRSGQAEKIMKNLGFTNVENIGSVSQAAKTLNRSTIK